MNKPCTIHFNTERDAIELIVPSDTGRAVHSLYFLAEPNGLAALARILKARASATEPRALGTESAPVQSQIEAWLRDNKPTTEESLQRAKDYSDISDEDFAALLEGINI